MGFAQSIKTGDAADSAPSPDPSINGRHGRAGLWFAYGFYTLAALASFFFVLKFIPETNGRQLEDME